MSSACSRASVSMSFAAFSAAVKTALTRVPMPCESARTVPADPFSGPPSSASTGPSVEWSSGSAMRPLFAAYTRVPPPSRRRKEDELSVRPFRLETPCGGDVLERERLDLDPNVAGAGVLEKPRVLALEDVPRRARVRVPEDLEVLPADRARAE